MHHRTDKVILRGALRNRLFHELPLPRQPSATMAHFSWRGSGTLDRLVGLVVKASAWRAEDPGFESRLRRDNFGARVIPVTSKLALQWLPCQAPGVIGSALGLVGPVSVYCDWVRWKLWSATSISVWQHVKSV